MAACRILVTGGAGQIGLELARLAWPDAVELHFPTRAELELSSGASIAAGFAGERWDAVINSAAYTAVDAAEDDVAAAFLANAQGPAWLAQETRKSGIPLIQISTDYVFAGAFDQPYLETDPVGPTSIYGASKLAGELAVRLGNPRSVVLRTAWVLSVHRANFLKTMLRAGAANPQLRVVADQIGCPTSAQDIAAALQVITLRLINDPAAPCGTYHFANAGSASWCELARTIFALAEPQGGPHPEVIAIATTEYPTKARRPANSCLDTASIQRDFGIIPRPWQEAVGDIVTELLAQGS